MRRLGHFYCECISVRPACLQVTISASAATSCQESATTSKLQQCSTTCGPGDQADALRSESNPPLYDALALQLWILIACQTESGLRDKPGKQPDYYHTCYCLSGLASSQHSSRQVLGSADNLLAYADPRLNVVQEKLEFAREFFEMQDLASRPTSEVSM